MTSNSQAPSSSHNTTKYKKKNCRWKKIEGLWTYIFKKFFDPQNYIFLFLKRTNSYSNYQSFSSIGAKHRLMQPKIANYFTFLQFWLISEISTKSKHRAQSFPSPADRFLVGYTKMNHDCFSTDVLPCWLGIDGGGGFWHLL